MKNRIILRLSTALIAAVLTFLSIVCDLPKNLSFAEGVNENTQGIGIYNRVYTADEDADVIYQVRFFLYDVDENNDYYLKEVTLENGIDYGGDMFLDTNGTITLPKNDGVVFSESPEFNLFLTENEITFIQIVPYDAGNRENMTTADNTILQRDKYKFYHSELYLALEEFYGEGYYGFDYGDEGGVNIDDGSNRVMTITSTKINPVVEVERIWRDRDVDRGTQGKSDFTVLNGSAVQTIEDACFELDNEINNKYIYSYYLPECNKYNQKINYTVKSNLDDTATHVSDPKKGNALEKNTDGRFTLTTSGLTDFTFTLEWLDAARENIHGDADDFSAYLLENFTLTDEKGDAQPITADQIELYSDDSGAAGDPIPAGAEMPQTVHVKITRLYDISENNTAKVYQLTPNDADAVCPLVSDASDEDKYFANASNLGVRSAVTGSVYEGGTLSMLLTGKKDFSGKVEWRDQALEESRRSNSHAADIVVWRFIDTEADDSEDIRASAQVGTIPIDGAADETTFQMAQVDKYDNQGNAYKYYAKEKLYVGSDYSTLYVSIDEPQEYLPEGGETVFNKISAMKIYSLDAKWIAAARQDGVASATFELQRQKDDGTWEAVPAGQVPMLDESGSIVRDANGNPVMVDAAYTMVIDTFRAEAMEAEENFPSVPVYDDEGRRITYRVVQTELKRKDRDYNGGEWTSAEGVSQSSPITLEAYPASAANTVAIGSDQYLVVAENAQNDPTKYIFTYKLVGSIDIQMVKVWADIDTVPHDGETVTFQIRRLDYGNGIYGDPHDYTFGSAQNWTQTVTVDRYDDLGHELDYIVNEINANRPGYYSTYQFRKSNTEYVYTVTNHPKGDTSVRYIGLRKEWIDDGELEFREPVYVEAIGDTADGETTVPGVHDRTQRVELYEGNAWQNHIYGHLDYNGENYANLFSEHVGENTDNDYWTIDDISAIDGADGISAEKRWIYQLLSEREIPNNASTGVTYVQNANLIGFDNLVGVFQNEQHYYAVQQEWKANSSMNGMNGELVFRNTRIGVVSYKIVDLDDFKGVNADTITETDTDGRITKITKQVTKDTRTLYYVDDGTVRVTAPIGSEIDGYQLESSVTSGSIPKKQLDEEGHEVPVLDSGGQQIYMQSAEITNKRDLQEKSLTVSKEWKGEASDAYKKLRPESLTYTLYCQYTTYRYAIADEEEREAALKAGQTLEFVADTTYDGPVENAAALLAEYPDIAGGEFAKTKTLSAADKLDNEKWNEEPITFEHLPVYLNTCADGRWNGKEYAVRYYVKESEPELADGKTNPYTYGVDYSSTQKAHKKNAADSNNSTDTALTGETPSVIASNELKTRTVTVNKVWNDNGYGTSLHYAIDFTLSGTGAGSGTDKLEYSASKTLAVNASSVTFTNAPKYDMNGSIINYSVAEKVHDSTATHQSGYAITAVSATTGASIRQDGYTVKTQNDNTVVVEQFTLTNSLPVIRFKADKVWTDNNNQDGKRPAQLNFTLQRHTGTNAEPRFRQVPILLPHIRAIQICGQQIFRFSRSLRRTIRRMFTASKKQQAAVKPLQPAVISGMSGMNRAQPTSAMTL